MQTYEMITSNMISLSGNNFILEFEVDVLDFNHSLSRALKSRNVKTIRDLISKTEKEGDEYNILQNQISH